MAKETRIILEDDLDGSEAAETFVFGYDGQVYEVDLSVENAAKIRDALEPFAGAARRLGRLEVRNPGPRRQPQTARTPIDREQNRAIRGWAEQQGKRVSPRGRIPVAIVEEYNTAHA